MDPNRLNKEDEASEKLVGDGEANVKVEIQLVGGESQNGETKIGMTEIKAAFIGMGKDELMKFANDPFWVKLRWFLFVLFWLLWFGMLFGAIAIILLAPKCSSPEPRDWYENSPIYHVAVSDFKDGATPQDGVGDLEGLLEKVSYFKELGVDTLLIDTLMSSTLGNPERVENFEQVDARYGTVENVEKVLTELKKEGLHVIMRIVPNYSSSNHTWFKKSIEKEDPYTDYYVWSNGKFDKPPNNWISFNGGSAWTWNDDRKQYYLHQFNETQPDLNFRNPKVVEYFSRVFKWWLDVGMSGIHVDKADFLFESQNFSDEAISNDNFGTVHDEYDFFRHTNTRGLPELVGVIKQWASVVKNSSGIFSVNGLPDTDEELDSVNLIHRPFVIKSGVLTAENLKLYVTHKLKKKQQTWAVENMGIQQPPDISECLTDMMLLLPGTLVVTSGAELGLEPGSLIPWDLSNSNAGFTTANSTWKSLPSNYNEVNVELEKSKANSIYHSFKSLVKERSSPSIIHGSTETSVINSTVFAFTRLKSGNPGYLVAFNLDTDEKVVSLSHMKHVPEELTVIARSKSLWEQLPLKTSIQSNNLKVGPASCVVLQFVPLSTEA